MARPTEGYKLQDGTRTVGVTTICGRFKESGGLITWANQQGLKGINIKDDTTAMDAGTLAHDMVEAHLLGQSVKAVIKDKPKEIVTLATQGYDNYINWEHGTGLKVISWENPLVSEKYRYGGTPDAIVEIGGVMSLADWKTSNAVYSDYLLQLAAYIQLWHENFPKEKLKGAHLLRFSKDFGDFVHYYFDDLSLAWEQFKLFLKAYENDKELKKRVK